MGYTTEHTSCVFQTEKMFLSWTFIQSKSHFSSLIFPQNILMRIFDLKSDRWLYKISYAETHARVSLFLCPTVQLAYHQDDFPQYVQVVQRGYYQTFPPERCLHIIFSLYLFWKQSKKIFSPETENRESQSFQSVLRLRSSSYLQQCRWEWVDPLMYNTEPVVQQTHWWRWHNRWRLRLSAESNAVTDSQLLWKYGQKNTSLTSCQLLRGEDRWHRRPNQLSPLIIHHIFSLARDWSLRITWLNIPN